LREPGDADVPRGINAEGKEQLARAWRRAQERELKDWRAGIRRSEELAGARFERDVRVHEEALARYARAEQARAPEREPGKPGGAPLKLWPRLALSEATRMWMHRAHNGSRREIARQVTKRVRSEIAADELAERKFTTFTRGAMNLVVDAIADGLLEWDEEKGLGVISQFSATPEWLPIPRSQAVS
jgi:hypothetical protein